MISSLSIVSCFSIALANCLCWELDNSGACVEPPLLLEPFLASPPSAIEPSSDVIPVHVVSFPLPFSEPLPLSHLPLHSLSSLAGIYCSTILNISYATSNESRVFFNLPIFLRSNTFHILIRPGNAFISRLWLVILIILNE